jgi:rod shape-determining protein MreD
MEHLPMRGWAVLRTVLVVVLLLVVQSTVMVNLTVGGAHPSILLLLPIAAGIVGGPEEGAVMGFVAGMAADLLLPTPFGLSALVGSLIGFAVGYSTGAITREVWWFPALVALAASAAWVMLYAVLGAVLGQGQFLEVDLVAVVAVVAVVNAALAGPAVRLVAWAFGESAPERPRPRVAGGRW